MNGALARNLVFSEDTVDQTVEWTHGDEGM